MIRFNGEPFDKVLYRNSDDELWNVSLYGGSRIEDGVIEQYVISEDDSINQIIPFNEETERLLLTDKLPSYRYQIIEKLENGDYALDIECVMIIFEDCIRKNNMYSVSYSGKNILIEEAISMPSHKDHFDEAIYVLENGGFVTLNRLQIPDSFNKPTSRKFNAREIHEIFCYLYESDDEFRSCIYDILLDEDCKIVPVSTVNYILDTLVTENIK